jgi:hypothetical protein
MRRKANPGQAALRCSFCQKSQEEVGKLISSPRAELCTYICDECVAVCAHIIEEDQQAERPDESTPANEPHRSLNHPLASELMNSLEAWIRQESLGHPGSDEFARFKELASRVIQER